jgi:nicotinamidase-related amidase
MTAMLEREKTGLVLVDVQGKLARIVEDSQALIDNIGKLVRACHALEIPVIWLEQIPEKLGATVPELATILFGNSPIAKSCFGGCGSANFLKAIQSSGRTQWLVCGIEAHVCVYQTVSGLIQLGYGVEVVADCVSSRTAANKALALAKMEKRGAGLTCLEMCLYEMMADAAMPKFRTVLDIIK